MKRKDFLKITSGFALSLVSRGWAGEGSSLLPDGPGSSSGVPKKGFLGESRRLGGLEVSSIGLGFKRFSLTVLSDKMPLTFF